MTNEERIDISEYGYDADKGIWSKHLEKFLEGSVNKKGYVVVGLKCTDGKYRIFYYHRVMWFLAYGPIPEGYQINHIREFEKTDNRLCNLELVTPKENINWGTHNERVAAKLKGIPMSEERKAKISAKMTNGKLSKPVVAVDEDNNVVCEFASINEAGRNGFSHSAVSACCRNCYYGNNIYKGYRWYYKEDWEKLIWETKLEVKKA